MEWGPKVQWNPYRVETEPVLPVFFSLFERKCPAGYDFPGETHNFWECLYVLRGEACVSGDDRVYQLRAGDMIFHKPMELHKFYVDSPTGADLFIFSFTMNSPYSAYFANKAFTLSEPQKDIIAELTAYIAKTMQGQTVPEEVILPLRFLYPALEKPTYLPTVETNIRRLFLSLLENASTPELSGAPDSRLFSQAVGHMKQHMDRTLSVAELAKACNISVSTLKRIFGKYAGISVHKYFLKLKLQKATDLLARGATVSETAAVLGFSGQAYFTKAFTREVGKNPSAFKP